MSTFKAIKKETKEQQSKKNQCAKFNSDMVVEAHNCNQQSDFHISTFLKVF